MNIKRITLYGLGIVVLLGAGYLAGNLGAGTGGAQLQSLLGLGGDLPTDRGSSGGEVIVLDNGFGPVQITFTDPSELPGEPPVAGGLFLRRQDNSLFLGTGSIEVAVEVVNGEASIAAHNDGPEVEVVVTGDTILYEDITEPPILGPEEAAKGEMIVQREVKLVETLDNITENMMIRVWGEKRGDRIIATLIYYDRVGID